MPLPALPTPRVGLARSDETRTRVSAATISLVLALVSAAGCNTDPRAAQPAARDLVQTSGLTAGPASVDIAVDVAAKNPYANDPTALQHGRRLYTSMNCAGCHGAAGGGGIGPPLADAMWIYGGQPENIVQAILEGRPNGMPAFGPQLPADEAWKIATYVSGMAAKSVDKSGTKGPTTPGSGAQGGNAR